MNKKIIIIFSVANFFFINAFATNCQSLIGNCDYYSCLSEQLQCQDAGYLVSFGKRYCEKFAQDEENFSNLGKSFLAKVKGCLQEQLEIDNNSLTCANVKQFALSDHIRCYLQNGFCDLDSNDKDEIRSIIFWDLLKDGHLRATAEIIDSACTKNK